MSPEINGVFGLKDQTVNRPFDLNFEPNPFVLFEELNGLIHHRLIPHKYMSSIKWGMVSSHQNVATPEFWQEIGLLTILNVESKHQIKSSRIDT